MLGSTTCPEKNLVDKAHMSTSHQQVFQFSCSTTSNNNNNYETSAELNAFQTRYPKQDKFYTPDKDCARENLNTIDGSSEPIELKLYEPCSHFNNIVETSTSAIKETTRDISSSLSTKSTNSHTYTKSHKSDNHNHTSSMCRTNDQENAFRQIVDVHNYSKLNLCHYNNRSNSENENGTTYSSNSSNREEDDDIDEKLEDGEEENYGDNDIGYIRNMSSTKANRIVVTEPSKSEKLDTCLSQNERIRLGIHVDIKIKNKCEDERSSVPPDHHARRPMNAFLIFCKRHRGIVKEKYKNFENRSITKILGEWWASLDMNEKKCYVSLAKQNKDAFFSANPNFKWYKLPAPSLRTLNARPCELERFFESSNERLYNDVSPISSQMSCATCSRSDQNKKNYFKLADETQMGELNNLMRPNPALSNQQTFVTHYEHLRTDYKRKSDVPLEVSPVSKHSNSDNCLSSSEDDRASKKWTRSCKGKKYQEFINSGQIFAVSPKKPYSSKQNIVHNSTSKCFVDKSNKIDSVKNEKLLPSKRHAAFKTSEAEYISQNSPNFNEFQYKQTRSFVPFDLEDKISALPAQCLDTYLQRKKNIKRKKINSKQRNPPQTKEQVSSLGTSQLQVQKTTNAQEVKERIMVGSQKRKARKESITRREISSVQNDVQLLIGKNSPTPQAFITVNQNPTSDLFILAEVAANHTDNA